MQPGYKAGAALLTLWLMLSLSLAGCTAVTGRLSEASYPGAPTLGAPKVGALTATLPPAILPPATATSAAPTQAASIPTGSSPLTPTNLSPSPAASSAAQTRHDEGTSLVYLLDGGLYAGDRLGAEPVKIGALPNLDAWAFEGGRLATTGGAAVELIDLATGRVSTAQADIPPEYAEVFWGASGQAVLYIALVPDGAAQATGRSVELRALSAVDGSEQGTTRLSDITSLRVLYYDDAQGRVALIRQPEAFRQVEWYDLHSGTLDRVFPAEGEGEAAVSPDGRFLLTEQFPNGQARLALYDLMDDRPPRLLAHPSDAHSVSHDWSPDGRYVAYLLREGGTFAAEADKGLGLWVLDVATMQARPILDEDSWASFLVGWTPDGESIMGCRRKQEASYYYAIRPDGGNRRILSVPPEAEILGWMSRGISAPAAVDMWQSRFVAAMGDPQATAGLMAEYLAAGIDEGTPAQRLAEYLRAAGWQIGPDTPPVRDAGGGTLAVSLPPTIYLVESHGAQAVAQGEVLLDARRVQDDLGLITGRLSDGFLQPAYTLLRRQPDGTWQMLWMPQGQRDWIATDGDIRFVGAGLKQLQVSGSSFGLDLGEQALFDECHTCVHRRLTATWAREGDGYTRLSQLPPEAPLADVLWEIAERAPYAILYEALRRARADLPTDDLLADANLIERMRGYGLLDGLSRLVCEEELANGVRFRDAAGARRYYARLEEGRLVGISEE